jgi:hypothetical protein
LITLLKSRLEAKGSVEKLPTENADLSGPFTELSPDTISKLSSLWVATNNDNDLTKNPFGILLQLQEILPYNFYVNLINTKVDRVLYALYIGVKIPSAIQKLLKESTITYSYDREELIRHVVNILISFNLKEVSVPSVDYYSSISKLKDRLENYQNCFVITTSGYGKVRIYVVGFKGLIEIHIENQTYAKTLNMTTCVYFNDSDKQILRQVYNNSSIIPEVAKAYKEISS